MWGRMLRGAGALGLTWGLAWATIGALVEGFLAVTAHQSFGDALVQVTNWAAEGAVSGICFAALFALKERGHSVDTLRVSRVVAWGSVATIVSTGVALVGLYVMLPGPVLVRDIAANLAAGAVFGGACGLGTIILSKRGSRRAGVAAA